jgi:hypothetical protein
VNLGRVCFPLLGNHRFPINGWALVHLGGIRVFIVAATIVFQWRMGKHRGVSRGELIAAFAEAAIPTEIPAAVYDYYKKGVIFKNFSVPLIRVIAMSMYCMKGMKTSMMMHSISCENSGWSYRLNLFCGKGKGPSKRCATLCFGAGFVSINPLSRLLHANDDGGCEQYMPRLALLT